MDKAWKRFEREVARRFGTHRTPLSGGSSRHTRSDSLHPRLFIECKYRKRLPFKTLYDIVDREAGLEDKTPVVVFVERGSSKVFVMCEERHLEFIAGEHARARRAHENGQTEEV